MPRMEYVRDIKKQLQPHDWPSVPDMFDSSLGTHSSSHLFDVLQDESATSIGQDGAPVGFSTKHEVDNLPSGTT